MPNLNKNQLEIIKQKCEESVRSITQIGQTTMHQQAEEKEQNIFEYISGSAYSSLNSYQRLQKQGSSKDTIEKEYAMALGFITSFYYLANTNEPKPDNFAAIETEIKGYVKDIGIPDVQFEQLKNLALEDKLGNTAVIMEDGKSRTDIEQIMYESKVRQTKLNTEKSQKALDKTFEDGTVKEAQDEFEKEYSDVNRYQNEDIFNYVTQDYRDVHYKINSDDISAAFYQADVFKINERQGVSISNAVNDYVNDRNQKLAGEVRNIDTSLESAVKKNREAKFDRAPNVKTETNCIEHARTTIHNESKNVFATKLGGYIAAKETYESRGFFYIVFNFLKYGREKALMNTYKNDLKASYGLSEDDFTNILADRQDKKINKTENFSKEISSKTGIVEKGKEAEQNVEINLIDNMKTKQFYNDLETFIKQETVARTFKRIDEKNMQKQVENDAPQMNNK